ncbi:MAG: hypothetical protein PHT78_12620 [Desulfitobacteriaceae bacterium]|nr:hypothetical protein [Desulfitobacteriaceae bacterium]
MSYDLNVLVLKQKEPSNIPFTSTISIVNEFQDPLRYFDFWQYMTSTEGVWYCLGHDRGLPLFDALDILDAKYNMCEEEISYPYWVGDEIVRENLIPLKVFDKYRNDFIKIVEYLIKQSPINTIMIMARFQGGEEDVICGVLSFEEFLLLHDQDKILFNVCYIIRG